MRRSLAIALVLLVLVLVLLGWGTDVGQEVVGDIVSALTPKAAWMRTIADEVARQLGELRPDLTSEQAAQVGAILAAQAAFETGYGKTTAWRRGFNFGNVTAGAGKPSAVWDGSVVEGPDTEYDADGNVKNITQQFRRYSSLANAVSDYLTTVLNWRAEKLTHARELLFAGNANGYIAALSEARYFTAPLADYQAGVAAAMEAQA